MAASKRCIILAGAPESDVLSWVEDALVDELDRTVQRFVGGVSAHMREAKDSTPSGSEAKWRSVPMDGERPVPIEHDGVGARSRPTSKQGLAEAARVEDADYLEHSMAFLDDIDCSQIITVTALESANGALGSEETSMLFSATNATETSFQTSFNGSFTTTELSSTQRSPGRRSPMKFVSSIGPISNLRQIPKADYITVIHPQTITVNLVVGVISISPNSDGPFTTYEREMDIVEITVGDETRAGFSISFWLAPIESQNQPKDDLREKLSQLRTGDVVMLQNVALTSFRGNVHGQSLGRRFAKNSTSVTLLVNKDLSPPLGGKLERVREWTFNFVGTEKYRSETSFDEVDGRKAKRRKMDELPPDTQD